MLTAPVKTRVRVVVVFAMVGLSTQLLVPAASKGTAAYPGSPPHWRAGGSSRYPGDGRLYGRVVMNDVPRAYYPLGETTPTLAADISTYDHSGAYGADVQLGKPGAIANDPDTSVLFAAHSDRVDTTLATNFTSGLSIEAWFRPTARTASGGVIVSKSVNAPTASDFTTNLLWKGRSAGVVFNLGTASAPKAIDLRVQTGTVSSGWHHIVGTFTANGTAKIYLDGAEKASKAAAWTLASNGRNWTIGRAPAKSASATWQAFAGRIDEVAIYDHALPADRVLTHYQAGTGVRLTAPKYFLRWEQAGRGSEANSTSTISLSMNGVSEGPRTVTAPHGFRNQAVNLGATSPGTAARLVQWRNTVGVQSRVRYMRLLGDLGGTWPDQYGSAPISSTDGSGGADAMQYDFSGDLLPTGVFADHLLDRRRSRYVAMGDSYQAGVGLGNDAPYVNNTETGCKRNALSHGGLFAQHEPALVYRQGGLDGWETDGYIACGGALTSNILFSGQFGEPAQVTKLDSSVRFVTLGVGGNDLGFGSILQDCVIAGITQNEGACSRGHDASVQAAFAYLEGGGLRNVYSSVAQKTSGAVYRWVFGYPHFFWNDGVPFLDFAYANCLTDSAPIKEMDRQWIDAGIQRLDADIQTAASQAAGWGHIDEFHLSDDHDLCNPFHPTQYLNGVDLTLDWPSATSESFHPTAYGYRVVEKELRYQFDPVRVDGSYSVRTQFGQRPQEKTVVAASSPRDVHFKLEDLDAVRFEVNAAEGAPKVRLISPTGRMYSSSSKRILFSTVEGQQVLWLGRPSAGTWTVRVTSGVGGRLPVTIRSQPVEIPVSPIAVARLTRTGARTASVVAHGSHDPDGRITHYLWAFGDKTYATGTTATHRYTKPGKYIVTLMVEDNDGFKSFAWSRTIRIR